MPFVEFVKEQLGMNHESHEETHEEKKKHRHRGERKFSPPKTAGQGYEIKPLSTADLHKVQEQDNSYTVLERSSFESKPITERHEVCVQECEDNKLNKIEDAECRKACNKSQIQTIDGANVIPFTGKDEAAANEMQRLNNILADYKTQMLALESSNRCLTEELNRVRQPLLAFQQHDAAVEKNQRAEFTHAVQKETQVRSELAHNMAETEDLKTRFERAEHDRMEQMLRANAMQEMVVRQEADKELMRLQKDEAERQRRELEAALEAVRDTLKHVRTDFETERQNREASEQQVQNLQRQFVDYEKSVQQLKVQVHQVSEVPAADLVQSDLKQNVEQIRRDYEQNREQLSIEFEQRANKFYNMWMSESKVCEQLRGELAEWRGKAEQLSELQRENEQLHGEIAALKQENIVANEKYDLLQQNYEATQRHCTELKTIVDSERQQLGGKSKLYGEVAVYRDIVEGELLDTAHPQQTLNTTTTTTFNRQCSQEFKKPAQFGIGSSQIGTAM